MRILILGGDGMLGHQLLKSYRGHHDVRVTLRRPLEEYAHYRLFDSDNAFPNVDVLDFDRVDEIVRDFKPEAVINAVGIVKQRAESQDAILQSRGQFAAATPPEPFVRRRRRASRAYQHGLRFFGLQRNVHRGRP